MHKRRHPLYNRALRILLVTNALVFIAGAMLGPIYAIFVEEIGGDILDASMTGAVYAFTAGVVVLLSGRLSDKMKENELLIVLGYAIIAVGFLLFTQVRSVTSLLIVQAVIGFGEAIVFPAYDAVYSKHLEKRKEGRQWAAWEASAYFTTAIGAFAGGLIVDQLGFDTLFVIMAALCWCSACYIFILPRKVL